VLALLDERKPLHVSLVGGDPFVRYHELELLLPQIESRGIHTQVVTSAFHEIPSAWNQFKKLNVVVSVDGLQPEHDARRKPATYERILKNIHDARVTIHCTITSQIADIPGYLDAFLSFWTSQREVTKVWFSLFSPQRGGADREIITAAQRTRIITELQQLRQKYPTLDMPEALLREMATPPRNPSQCIFARTTETVSADLKTWVTPCQFGGDPDCGQCGCYAAMGMAAVGHYRVLGALTAGRIYMASDKFGKTWRAICNALMRKVVFQKTPLPLKVIHP